MNKPSARCVGLAGLIGLALRSQAAAPAGWADRCFGNESAGSATYSDLGGDAYDITLEGAGLDIWGKSDTGRFVFLPLAGDCEIMATIDALPLEEQYGEWARFGLMMRGSLMINAVNTAFCRVKGSAATGGRLKLTQRAANNADTANWPGVSDTSFATNLNMTARLRLVRQGDTYTAWISTNTPAYDAWERVASHTTVFHGAMNVGVFVSRWQDLGPDTLTRIFNAVKARNLVAAATNASDGITVNWIGDPAVTNGTVIGYAVSRADGPAGTFSALGETAAGVLSYDDAAAGLGTSYVYRVHAYVDEGDVTNSVLIGSSLPTRRPVLTGNPSPAALKGVYAEYYQPRSPGTLKAARVDPNIDNSWNYSDAQVFPAYTPNGLNGRDDFRTLYAGNLIVQESGCYGLVQRSDDGFYMWVDGVQVVDQGEYQNNNEIHTAPVWLEAGRSYPMRVEHYEGSGGENAILRWFKGTAPIETIPQAYFEPFPWPWQHRDMGDSPRFGNAIYSDDDSSVQTFTVTSGGLGLDPATGREDGHFVWQTCATDFDLIATVSSLTGPPGMAAGLTMRGSSADNAAALSLAVISTGPNEADRELGLAYRATAGGVTATATLALPETPPDLRLTRRGTNLWAYYRTAGSGGWVIVTNISSQLTGTLYAGMMVSSRDISQTATGVFSTVSFVYPQNNTFYATVANNAATVSVSNKPPMQVRQENDDGQNVKYYWSDALNGDFTSYTVFRSNRPDQDFSAIGQTTPSGGGFTYTDPLLVTNTLVFYRLETAYALGPLAAGGSNDLLFTTGVYGVSDGSVTGTGEGLFAAFHRGAADETYVTNLPVHTMVRNLNSWEKGTAPNDTNPMVPAASSDDGVQVGPDNFQATWAGWIIPQYTGYHWFRTQTDDAISVWVGGKRVIYFWGYTASAQTSAAVWLEAGKPVPIHIYFQQGTGGGYFRMWWKHGYGMDGGFVTIPAAQLVSKIPDGTPITVAPEGPNTFGQWRNIDINTARPGYAALGGTPTAFDCTITGSGADIWDRADGLHFIYQEVDQNFEIEATFNSFLLETEGWAKTGLMVRDGTNANARNMCLIVSRSNGYRIQLRNTDGDTSTSLAPPEIPDSGTAAATTPVTLKLVRSQGKILAFINGKHVTYTGGVDIDVSGWSRTLCVGLAMTAHNNSRLCPAFVSDVTFDIVQPKGTVLFMR